MKRIFIERVGIFLLVAFLLSACATGGSSDSNGNINDDGGDGDSNVTVSFDENVQTLDPHDSSSGNDISVINTMYESMYTPDEDGEFQPLLAEDHEVSDDGLTYTFNLVKDAVFADGSEFDAEVAEANFDRLLDSEGSLNSYKSLRGVEDVEATDDYEIEITLENPNSQFLEKVSRINMISPEALEDDDWEFSKESAGTGQYVLEKWSQGDKLVAKKNDDYWGDDKPGVDQITFKPTPEDGARVAALKTGETDIIYPVPETDVESLEDEEGVDIDEVDSTYVNYATINTSKEPFDDKKVRQAMNLAIDQDEYINVVKDGYATKSDSILPEPNVYYSEQEPYDHDVEKAKELMKEAGYEDGFSTEIWGSDSSKDKKGMQFIEQQLSEIGIDVEVKQMERGTLDTQINEPDSPEESTIQMWYVGWSSTIGDTDNAINPLFHSDSFPSNGSNTAYYDNDEVDELIADALHATEDDEAADKYAKIQEIVFDDAPWLFLGVDEQVTAYNSNLKGAWRSADGNLYLRNLEVE